ncbi:hypothetical protein, partial, partial [Absidia glauca]
MLTWFTLMAPSLLLLLFAALKIPPCLVGSASIKHIPKLDSISTLKFQTLHLGEVHSLLETSPSRGIDLKTAYLHLFSLMTFFGFVLVLSSLFSYFLAPDMTQGGFGAILGRVYTVAASNVELYHMRQLLYHVPGALG